MSTVAPVRAGLGPSLKLQPAEIVVVRRILVLVLKILAAVAPIAVVVVSGLVAVIANVSSITQSTWEVAGQWPRWWLFVAGITAVTTYLPVLVTHGMTRSAVARALGLAGVLTCALWTGVMIVGHVVERFAYARFGWPDRMTTSHLFSNGYDVLPMFVEYELIFLAYAIAGALIGAVYYRFGGIRGTLLLPLAGLPGAVVEALISGWYQSEDRVGGTDALSAGGVLVLVSVAAILLGAVALHLVIRDVPIHSKK
jgi:hypothetical protein